MCIRDSAKKVTLAITGGEQYGDHFQLEGSVRIHRSRYLHVKTQFWLSAFEANQGQELQYWPKLPDLPIPLGSEFNHLPSLAAGNSLRANDRLNSWSDVHSRSTVTSDAPNSQQTNPTGINEGSLSGEISPEENAQLTPHIFPRYSDDPFIIKNIMTLNQSRRMRSNEIHYICLLYTSPSPRDLSTSRMPSSA